MLKCLNNESSKAKFTYLCLTECTKYHSGVVRAIFLLCNTCCETVCVSLGSHKMKYYISDNEGTTHSIKCSSLAYHTYSARAVRNRGTYIVKITVLVCMSVCLFPHSYATFACTGLIFLCVPRGSWGWVVHKKSKFPGGWHYYEGIYVNI